MFNPSDHYVHVLAITPGDEDRCRERVQAITNRFKESDEGKLLHYKQRNNHYSFIITKTQSSQCFSFFFVLVIPLHLQTFSNVQERASRPSWNTKRHTKRPTRTCFKRRGRSRRPTEWDGEMRRRYSELPNFSWISTVSFPQVGPILGSSLAGLDLSAEGAVDHPGERGTDHHHRPHDRHCLLRPGLRPGRGPQHQRGHLHHAHERHLRLSVLRHQREQENRGCRPAVPVLYDGDAAADSFSVAATTDDDDDDDDDETARCSAWSYRSSCESTSTAPTGWRPTT